MIITYKLDGEPERAWPFDAGKMMSPECEAIERVTGVDYLEFQKRLATGSAKCRRALLWVFLKREHPTLRFDDVTFPYGAVDIEFSMEDLGRLEKQAHDVLRDDELDETLRALDVLRESAYEVVEGKAVRKPAVSDI
jgi:hypothetical protein